MAREVAVTGMGVVSPLGNHPQEMFENLLEGRSGIGPIARFDTADLPVRFAAEVRAFDAARHFDPKELGRTSRYIQYIMHASLSAVEHAGLAGGGVEPSRAGMILGSGIGGMEIFYENSVILGTKGPKRVSPFFVPMSITNLGSGMVAMRLGWHGPNWSVSSACSTGNHAIFTAADQIRMGRADVMLAGGAEESVCLPSLVGFANMRALSRRNEDPASASRPFDTDRDGFVLGEGAGALVLEAREHAEARGAPILAVIKGYGTSCDAYHMTAPLETGEGVCIAIENALSDAGISREDVGIVNAHATSTPLGDVAEIKALRKVFGAHLDRMQVHATKSMIGHLLGGASAVEAVTLIFTLNSGQVHPTVNVFNQDPECVVNCVPNARSTTKAEFGISNSFGFGGHNSCLVLQKGG